MKAVRRGAGLVCILLFLPFSVMAFVPEGPHLVDMMVQAMGAARKVRLGARLEIMVEEGEAAPFLVQENFFFKIPEAFRSETDDGRRLRVGTKTGDFLLVLDGKVFRERAGLEDLFYPVLLVRNRPALVSFLETLGLDMKKTALTRFAGRICYRLGEEAGPRLLVDKETLRPLALTLMKREEGRLLREVTFRYRDWQVFAGAAWPMKVETLEGDRLLQVMMVETVKEETFSDALFAIDRLRVRYPASSPVPEETQVADPLGDIEQRLELLRKRYH